MSEKSVLTVLEMKNVHRKEIGLLSGEVRSLPLLWDLS